MTTKKSLKQLAKVMARYGRTLFKADGSCKTGEEALEAIQETYARAFSKDRIKIIGILDGKDIESKEFIKAHGLEEEIK